MKKIRACFVFFLLCSYFLYSQNKFTVQNREHSNKIKFEFINNLVIIPVEINGVTLSFLLDTGVSKPIIFNFLNVSDSLNIKHTENIFLRGLGEGESVLAKKSINNVVKVGDAIKLNQDLYAIYDANLNFSPKLGVPVHGIIGYDLFKDLIVEINYAKKFLKLSNPEYYNYKACRKCETLPLEFYNNKPYINTEVSIENREIPVKLLIDSGGSDSLWLFQNDSLGIQSHGAYFNDFLGHGLSGSVYGKRSKIDALNLKSFTLKDVNVAYPDSSSILSARQFKNRNGSLAGNVLKRFNVVFNYQKGMLTLKKNSFFKEDFNYNKSGIELEHNGVRLVREVDNGFKKTKSVLLSDNEAINKNTINFDTRYKISLKPSYSIVELRDDSPASKAGLKIDDVILAINGKPTYNFTLQKLTQLFYEEDGKKIRLKVDRAGKELNFVFNLKSPLQKKKLNN